MQQSHYWEEIDVGEASGLNWPGIQEGHIYLLSIFLCPWVFLGTRNVKCKTSPKKV